MSGVTLVTGRRKHLLQVNFYKPGMPRPGSWADGLVAWVDFRARIFQIPKIANDDRNAQGSNIGEGEGKAMVETPFKKIYI